MYPPPANGAVNDYFVSVICLFEGFSDKDLYVEWKKDDKTIAEHMYMNTEPILTDDNETYIMFSRALVSKKDWNRGETIFCSGGLRNISSKFIKKSGN